MINYKEIERKLDEVLNNETPESLKKWLDEKREEEEENNFLLKTFECKSVKSLSMNLYKITLAYGYEHSKMFTYFVIGTHLDEVEKLAIKTFMEYGGDSHVHTIELVASEGQYAKPNVLLIGVSEQ